MIEQGSQEWLQMRIGKLTASRMADVLATTKTGESASRKNYRAQLVAERLTGQIAESFTNSAMQWGIDNELLARAEYEIKTGNTVEQVAFVDHPGIKMCGASPDGLIGNDGLIEIKCPNTATHIEYLLSGSPPDKYIPQMDLQLICTGREWCDFMSFDPRLPEKHRLFIVRYAPTFERLQFVTGEATAFLNEVNELIEKMENL